MEPKKTERKFPFYTENGTHYYKHLSERECICVKISKIAPDLIGESIELHRFNSDLFMNLPKCSKTLFMRKFNQVKKILNEKAK